jgi:hypothetical protein
VAASAREGEHPGKTATLAPYPRDPTKLLVADRKFKVTLTTSAMNLAGLAMSSAKS